ncbi:LytR/AlgR family response regulator transcription factor [Flavilitoribacter nigricans]|uniref:DNA-binding response regulator n=1 Tax=Flavilitoribacter nigricans (strain ATCC 23147 / DSM 23189 / NBRC 102662 / NCIMB 1420 / SS-2) TaxID=1122177 RepID=A0A2D0NAW8_FLAN2|nr:LytTR family DNA-binding domain-containing protein [Flavilitoribacter nigricans]PHN05528.1 DNA-binding response regulator [Flavilitoribacter nigricans DSM 23189 = NBRC 102662]
MIRVVIVDDEQATRNLLKQLFKDYFPDVQLIGEADDVASGVELLKKETPDLLLLDIQMPDGSGFDLLNQFRNPGFQLIFVTAFDKFALKAFDYNAIDYLLKPLDPKSLRKAIDKIHRNSDRALEPRLKGMMDMLETRQTQRIALSSAEGYAFYSLEEIVRLESSGGYTTFFVADGQRTTVAKTIKDYEELLPEDMFFRVHQSHIVALQYVRKFLKAENGQALMSDGCKIPVARRKKDKFIELLTKYTL